MKKKERIEGGIEEDDRRKLIDSFPLNQRKKERGDRKKNRLTDG